MYFYYGITHSSLENPTEEIELKVDTSYLDGQSQENPNNDHHQQQPQTAVWDRHGYENKMADDSWSTQNNYTSSWDTNETNRSWSNKNSNNYSNRPPPPPPPTSKSKSPQPPRAKPPSTATTSSSSSGTAAGSSAHQQKSTASQQPKGGFGSIFVDESQFPKWED